MKTTNKFLAILVILTVSIIINTKQASAQYVDVSYQVFYDQLSPYGQWVSYPNYGYVWLPDAGPDFSPYSTGGYWIMTDYGMTWVSNYSWGWAPFHYGRWDYDNYYGWFWVPGNEWGPAWVTWRSSNDYYGWAPMRPGISISISFGNHHYDNYNRWIFVRACDIDRHDIHRHHVNHRDHDWIIRNSTVINNTYIDNSQHITYVSGPDRDDIRRNTGRNIRTVSIHENNSPGQDLRSDRLNIYRPRITKDDDLNRHSTPIKITDRNNIKHRSDNNTINQEQSENNNRKQIENRNQSDENRRKQQGNINQTNENNRKQQDNIKQSNEIKRKQQDIVNQSNNNNRRQVENKSQSNDSQRKQQQNNENIRNNNKNVNNSNNNRFKSRCSFYCKIDNNRIIPLR